MLTELLSQPIHTDVHLPDLTTAAFSRLSDDEVMEVHRRVHRSVLLSLAPSPWIEQASLCNALARQEMVARNLSIPPAVRELDEHSLQMLTELGLPARDINRLRLGSSLPSVPTPADRLERIERQVSFCPVRREDVERQIVFGIVYEPYTLDSFGTWATPELIEEWAHTWLARFQNSTINHREPFNDRYEIYESYIAPVEFSVGGQNVKKGTWLLMTHILDSEVWAKVKRGEITGYSIGAYSNIEWGSVPPSTE